jgi:hypothetical protein
VEPPSETTPRMFAVEFNSPTDRPSFTVVLIAMCPRQALEQAFWMFPGLLEAHPECHVREVAFIDIDWKIGLALVAKRKHRPPMLLMDLYSLERQAAGAAGSHSGKVKGQG